MNRQWWSTSYAFSIILLICLCSAVPKPEDAKRDRVLDKPLSDETHYGENEAHNVEYDHEAFLGKEAKTFDQLTPEESKERLSKIVDKIDKDKDGFITEQELKDWIQYTQKKYILDDVERQWESHNNENKELLNWDDYKKAAYSFIDEVESEAEDDDMKTYREMMMRDKRRWTTADKDSDDNLSKEEFADFLHPEEAPHMQDIVILETLEDIDKDKDGKVSLDEYIGDLYSGSEDEQPEWVQNEKEQFSAFRDKDKDGFMDKSEVREWILPSDYNHSEAEAKHLILEADENKDQKLTKDEIISNYDLFVGSQATDFGEALVRHDEF